VHLKIGNRVRLINDIISSDYHRDEIYVSGTKGSIAVVLSQDEFLSHEPYQEMYTREEITEIMIEGQWYPIRYETKAPLSMIKPSGFDVIDQCYVGSVALVSSRDLEKLNEDAL
jgi:hypothetical protein